MIVIRGMGAVSSCGRGTESLVENLREGLDSSSPLTSSKSSLGDGFSVNRISPDITDHTEKTTLFKLLGGEAVTGVKLTACPQGSVVFVRLLTNISVEKLP